MQTGDEQQHNGDQDIPGRQPRACAFGLQARKGERSRKPGFIQCGHQRSGGGKCWIMRDGDGFCDDSDLYGDDTRHSVERRLYYRDFHGAADALAVDLG